VFILIVNATEFKTRAGKYLELVEIEDVIITRNGKEVAKLVPIKKQGTPNADYLYGLMADSSNKDITVEQIKAERIKNKYESND
jgi:prevent-host-death family protein